MKSAAAVTTALAVLALMGCGGGGGDSSESSLTKAQFVKQATAICHREKADILTKIGAYFAKHENSGKSEDEVFAGALRAVYLPTIETELAKIRALGAPDGDETQVEAILSAEQEAVDAVARLKSVSNGRFGVEEYFRDAAKLASAYGIPDCGNGPVQG